MGQIVLLLIFVSGALFLTPWFLLGSSPDKSSERYRVGWWKCFVLFAAISLAFFLFIMSIPYYSQVSHRSGAGGADAIGANMEKGLLFLLLFVTVLVPSFIYSFVLGLFPPESYSRKKQLAIKAIVPLSVVVMVLMMFLKREVYKADRYEFLHPSYTPAELEEAKIRKEREQEWELEAQKERQKERDEKEERERVERAEREERRKDSLKERQKDSLEELKKMERWYKKQLEEGERRAESIGEKERVNWEIQKKRLIEGQEKSKRETEKAEIRYRKFEEIAEKARAEAELDD